MIPIIKIEFRRRLLRLRKAIDLALANENIDWDLFPALFSVYSFLFGCHDRSKLVKYKSIKYKSIKDDLPF